MVQYIITPWRSAAELLKVRQQLYPADGEATSAEEKKEAVARVSVWMQRGNCPHLVESTAILMSAVLNDGVGNSSYCVRAAYAAAFCRFVTGLLDSHQDKRRKLSMYSIAKTIGLPATYVELRHQATHEELPSLPKLRTAAQKALRWIWDYYWSKLSETSTVSTERDCKAFLHRLLQETDDEKRESMTRELGSWNQEQVMDTLMEIQSSSYDVNVLLRASQVQQSFLLSGDSDVEMGVEQQKTELERLRDEISRMGEQLESSSEATTPAVEVNKESTSEVVKGWTMWEGPWVPKPIGVV